MFLVAVYMFVSNPQACGRKPFSSPPRARAAGLFPPPARPRPPKRSAPERDTSPRSGNAELAGVEPPVLATSLNGLLDLDLGADLFELLLDRGRLLLRDTLLHDLGGAVDEVL